MKLKTKTILAAVAVTAALAALAWQRYWYYLPGLIADFKDPVGMNQPVEWDRGPEVASVPAGERPPNIVLILADDLGFNDLALDGGGLVGAPECGDVMKLQVRVNPDTGVIDEAKFKTFGCARRSPARASPPSG